MSNQLSPRPLTSGCQMCTDVEISILLNFLVTFSYFPQITCWLSALVRDFIVKIIYFSITHHVLIFI